MSEPNMQQNTSKPNDEIDIFEFCSRIWKAFMNFLTGIKDLIVSFIIFLIRKSLWIISFALFGIILGYIMYGVSRPYYTSSLEGNTGGIYDPVKKKYAGGVDNSVVIDHINKLNLLTGNPSLLANYLGISVEQAEDIRSIKAYYGIDVNKDMKPDYVDIKETYNPRDTMQCRVPSYLSINVSVHDESVLPVLRKGLFQFINNNTYIQELFRVDKQQKKDLLQEIGTEIGKIDSLQRTQFRKERARSDRGQLVIVGNEPEPRLFYKDLLLLYEQKQNLEKNIAISDEIIVVVQDFTPLQQEVMPVLHYIIILGVVMAVVGLICALIWQYRKKIWILIRERQ